MGKYKKWATKEGVSLSIESMSDDYIKNCVIMIINSINPVQVGGEDLKTFSGDWVKKHGMGYMKVFYKELESRNEVRIRDIKGLESLLRDFYRRSYGNKKTKI